MPNTAEFMTLAGDVSKWEEEIRQRCRPGRRKGTFNYDDVRRVEAEQYDRGLRSARLVRSVKKWVVRACPNHDGRSILFMGTFKACLKFGKDWANEDPLNREFFGLRSDLGIQLEDTVQTWWSDGHLSGHGFFYGIVIASGPKTYTVLWESGLRNRVRRDNKNVTIVTNSELLAEVGPKLKRAADTKQEAPHPQRHGQR